MNESIKFFASENRVILEYKRKNIEIHTYIWLYMKERDIKEEKIKIKKTVKSLRKMNFVVCKIICSLERKENLFLAI